MFTILFTAVGRRVGLIQTFRDSFAKHGLAVRLVGTNLEPSRAPAGYFLDHIYPAPKYTDPDYTELLLEVTRKEKVDLVIPLYEPEFLELERSRDRFEASGALLMLSQRPVLELCRDKWKTYAFFQGLNLGTPESWLDPPTPTFEPGTLFVKPRYGMGSKGAAVLENWAQWTGFRPEKDFLYQEYIQGTEYSLDVLADLDGRVLAVVPRERIEVRAGEVIKSKTVKRDDLIAAGSRIVTELGASGPLNLQCIDNGKAIYWLEINPRFGGGAPLMYHAGVDYPYLLYRMCNREKLPPLMGEFQDNLMMLRYDQALYV